MAIVDRFCTILVLKTLITEKTILILLLIIQGESKKALLTYSEGYENNDEVVFTNDSGLLTAGAYLGPVWQQRS